jgi:large subunit ribosomal protein L18
MSKRSHKADLLARRRNRVRKKVTGTPEVPRLSVRRSLKHIYAQIIDDLNGKTLASASSVTLNVAGGNVDGATKVGAALAEAAKAASVSAVRFDRNGRKYHGRVKALADSAREGGLKF